MHFWAHSMSSLVPATCLTEHMESVTVPLNSSPKAEAEETARKMAAVARNLLVMNISLSENCTPTMEGAVVSLRPDESPGLPPVLFDGIDPGIAGYTDGMTVTLDSSSEARIQRELARGT